MKKLSFVTISIVFLLGIGGIANATNGDNFMAIGPIARSMGGVGIAAPQDALSAVFANPAGMCFGPYCPGSQVDFAATVFLPVAHGKIEVQGDGMSSDRSQSNIFVVPAIGLSTPISSDSTSFLSKFRFGLAAYGSSGLGVDYRDRLNTILGPQGEVFTQYQVFKFAPNLAYRITDNLSVGVNFQVDYGSLDLGAGTSSGFGFGGQLGAIYKIGPVSLGLSYVFPQTIKHTRVYDFNGDGSRDALKLQMPQTVGLGIAFQPRGNLLLKDDNLLIEGNFKWINWAGAQGYKDFDWRDQYVFAFGVQYKPIPKLALRAGVNYGQNPVKEHNGWDATSFTTVQGKSTSTFGYEYLRIIGFPALVETHLTFGIGYELSEKFVVNIGYTHAFANKISETGINFGGVGGPNVTLGSKLAEDSIDVGLSWRF
jgi:long-chain fatty acid transport protein